MINDIQCLYLSNIITSLDYCELIESIICQECKTNLKKKIDEMNGEKCECNYNCFICSSLISRFLTKFLYKIKCSNCKYTNKPFFCHKNKLLLISTERCSIKLSHYINGFNDNDLIFIVKPLVNQIYHKMNWDFQRILWISYSKQNRLFGKLSKENIEIIIHYVEIETNDLIEYIYSYLINNNHLLDTNLNRINTKFISNIAIPLNKYIFRKLLPLSLK